MSVALDADLGASDLLPVFSGHIRVRCTATGPLGRFLAWRFGLKRNDTVDGELAVTSTDVSERWERTFGRRTWASQLYPGTHLDELVEHIGPLRPAI